MVATNLEMAKLVKPSSSIILAEEGQNKELLRGLNHEVTPLDVEAVGGHQKLFYMDRH